MKIKILRVEDDTLIDGVIRDGLLTEMPSIHDGWKFNFNKQYKLPNSKTFVIVLEDSPTIIQGCLVFQMLDGEIPYMAYLEIAPNNQGLGKEYDYVAGCLIAFACRLSFIHGKGDHKGWLTFDVGEDTEENQNKLMSLYSKRYKAMRFEERTMLIKPEDGEMLIEEYLKN
jgi:hypothetical protein